MYILTNALQNLLRNRGRNLMIGVIILVIIISTVTALMINNTADSVINDYKTRFGSEVTISPKMQMMVSGPRGGGSERSFTSNRISEITPEMWIAFGNSDYLQKAMYYANTKANSKQLKAIDEEKGGWGAAPSWQAPTGSYKRGSNSISIC